MSKNKNKELELCACPDVNGARAYVERDPFDECPRDANGNFIQYGMLVCLDGCGSWEVIDIHCESGFVGLDSGEGILYVDPSRVSCVD